MSGLLVVLDPDLNAPQPALGKAARLAGDEPVSVFVNVRSPGLEKRLASGLDELDQARQRIIATWDEHIRKLAETASLALDQCRILWSGSTYEDLMNTMDELSPSMVVVHSHYEPRLKRLLFAPLEWKLIRNAGCPLLFVGDQHWSAPPPVVAAVDPDPFSETPDALTQCIVRYAQYWAERLNSPLSLVHALEDPDEALVMLAGEEIPTSVNTADTQRRLYEQRLDGIRRAHGLAEDQVQLIEGRPAHALADYMASLPPGLLIMGTVQKNSVERLLLGNTAEDILFRSASDVLVLHNPESASSGPA